jgi:hypothetical protein
MFAISVLVVAACGGSHHVAAVSVIGNTTSLSEDGRTLTFAVNSCHGSPEVTVTAASATEIKLVVHANVSSDDKCADSATITLSQPVDDRSVVDGTTGKTVWPQR